MIVIFAVELFVYFLCKFRRNKALSVKRCYINIICLFDSFIFSYAAFSRYIPNGNNGNIFYNNRRVINDNNIIRISK